VTVHLAYATGDFHCLLDGDLFPPKNWSDNRDRCRAAGISDDVVYRPKWKIALELYDRARGNGVVLDWLAFDEAYDGKPEFLRRSTVHHEPFDRHSRRLAEPEHRPPGVARQHQIARQTAARPQSRHPQAVLAGW
jgi:hypothetical protein